jgi:hypothetical protein
VLPCCRRGGGPSAGGGGQGGFCVWLTTHEAASRATTLAEAASHKRPYQSVTLLVETQTGLDGMLDGAGAVLVLLYMDGGAEREISV